MLIFKHTALISSLVDFIPHCGTICALQKVKQRLVEPIQASARVTPLLLKTVFFPRASVLLVSGQHQEA